jgi:hypothetical protein
VRSKDRLPKGRDVRKLKELIMGDRNIQAKL